MCGSPVCGRYVFGQTEVVSGAANMHQVLVELCKRNGRTKLLGVVRGIVKTIIYNADKVVVHRAG